MKVAVCIAGHMRNYELCAPSLFKHCLRGQAVDIFIATYGVRSAGKVSDNRSIDIDHVKSTYEAREVKVVPDVPRVVNSVALDEGYRHAIVTMWKLIWTANQMCRQYAQSNNIEYDLVIRSRPDVLFREDTFVPFNELDRRRIYSSGGLLLDPLKSEKFIPWASPNLDISLYREVQKYDLRNYFRQIDAPPKPLTDHWAIGSPEIMDAYAYPYELLCQFLENKFPTTVRDHASIFDPPIRKWRNPIPSSRTDGTPPVTYSMWAHGISVDILDSIYYTFERLST